MEHRSQTHQGTSATPSPDVDEVRPDSAQHSTSSRGGGIPGRIWHWFTDPKEKREDKKREKPAPQERTPQPTKSRPKVSRRARLLGGNRWKASAMMAALIVVTALTLWNTAVIAALPSNQDIQDQVATAMRDQGSNYPVGQATSWAEQVAYDWATWDEDNPDEREVRMAQYLTKGMDPQAGWNGQGTQSVTFTSVNTSPTVLSEHRALVDVAYRLEDDSRRCLTIPIYAYKPDSVVGTSVQWAFGLAATPTPRPCSPRTGAADPSEDLRDTDGLRENPELAQTLATSFFPGFFAAWAASDDNELRQYTASGVRTIGLGGAMVSTPPPSVQDVTIQTPKNGQPQEGTVYYAIVPVTWTIAGSEAEVQATYRVPMKLAGDRWYVAGEPEPAAQLSEAASGAPADAVPPEGGNSSAPETDTQSPEDTPAASSEEEGE